NVVSGCIINLHAEEDNAVLKQFVIGVLALVAVSGALFELRQDVTTVRQIAGRAESGGLHGCLSPQRYFLAVPPPPATSVACSRMWSTKPYSSAASAVNQRSRSPSSLICSADFPVCAAVISARRFFIETISCACV